MEIPSLHPITEQCAQVDHMKKKPMLVKLKAIPKDLPLSSNNNAIYPVFQQSFENKPSDTKSGHISLIKNKIQPYCESSFSSFHHQNEYSEDWSKELQEIYAKGNGSGKKNDRMIYMVKKHTELMRNLLFTQKETEGIFKKLGLVRHFIDQSQHQTFRVNGIEVQAFIKKQIQNFPSVRNSRETSETIIVPETFATVGAHVDFDLNSLNLPTKNGDTSRSLVKTHKSIHMERIRSRDVFPESGILDQCPSLIQCSSTNDADEVNWVDEGDCDGIEKIDEKEYEPNITVPYMESVEVGRDALKGISPVFVEEINSLKSQADLLLTRKKLYKEKYKNEKEINRNSQERISSLEEEMLRLKQKLENKRRVYKKKNKLFKKCLAVSHEEEGRETITSKGKDKSDRNKSITKSERWMPSMEEKHHIGSLASRTCDVCGIILSYRSNMKKHKEAKHPSSTFVKPACPVCGVTYSRTDVLKKHQRKKGHFQEDKN